MPVAGRPVLEHISRDLLKRGREPSLPRLLACVRVEAPTPDTSRDTSPPPSSSPRPSPPIFTASARPPRTPSRRFPFPPSQKPARRSACSSRPRRSALEMDESREMLTSRRGTPLQHRRPEASAPSRRGTIVLLLCRAMAGAPGISGPECPASSLRESPRARSIRPVSSGAR